PAASFSTNTTEGNAPLDVAFTDLSTGNVTAWAWDFGDGNTSTDRNATHTYAAPGLYSVTLNASNPYGYDLSAATAISVLDPPVANFSANATVIPTGSAVAFTDASTGNVTAWAWDFGDGNTSTDRNATHTYTAPGTYTVSLTATNAYGSDTKTMTGVITVYSAGPRYVATYADLCKVGTGADGWTLDADYIQTADIQCPAESNFPRIGLNPGTPFTGTYDGRGYAIQDLTMEYSDFDTGMFISIGQAGSVQNVTLIDVNVTGHSSQTGALAGQSKGTIRNCHVSGSVFGTDSAGGLVGTLGTYLGSDVGWIESSSSCCTVTNIGQYSTYQGGLIGYALSGNIIECSASGDVVDGHIVGGLIGKIEGGTVTVARCYAAGSIVDSIGWSGNGGLIGSTEGSVSVTDCYATGAVSAPSGVGGLIGAAGGSTVITNCYAAGSITATDEYGAAGGLIGSGGGASSSYWDIETSGQAASAGGAVGKTTAEMKTIATFA
ncbi:MAG TPA: PKD domain-containing protein, partial [Corynebacterium sp.]|nr:PKD domain-containing protein [Corynebacterium sp.]